MGDSMKIGGPTPSEDITPQGATKYSDAKEYVKNREMAAQLVQIQQIAKRLQQEELKRARGAQAKAPAKSQAANPYDAQDAILVKYLKELLPILEKHLGSDPDLAKVVANFSKILKDFPNLTAEDIHNLQDMPSGISQLSQKLPSSVRLDFLKKLSDMLSEAINANKGTSSSFQSEIRKLRQEVQNNKRAQNDLATIEQLLAKLQKNGKLDQSSYEKLAEAVTDLLKAKGSLPPSMQKQVESVFGEMENVKMKGGYSLAEYIADLQTGTWVNQFLQNRPTATMQQLLSYLQTQMGKLAGTVKGSPFATSYHNSLLHDLTQVQQGGPGKTGLFFDAKSNGNVTIAKGLWQNVIQMGNPVAGGMNALLTRLREASLAIKEDAQVATGKITTLNSQIGELDAANGALNDESGQVLVEIYAPQGEANPLTAEFKTMTDHLEKMCALLLKYAQNDPALVAKASQLSKIAGDYPNISAADIDSLQSIAESVPSIASGLNQSGKLSDDGYTNFLSGMESMLEAMKSTNKGQVAKYPKMGAELNKANKGVDAALGEVGKKKAAKGSLPDDFSHVVLKHYMPGQEAYLMQLAMMFSIFNFGASMGNLLLGTISNWGTASNDFDLGNWFAANPNATYADAQAHLTQEEQNVAKYLDEITKLLQELRGKLDEVNGKISDIQKKLKNDKSLTPQQKKSLHNQLKQWEKMQKQLTTDIGNSKQTQSDLTLLKDFLAKNKGKIIQPKGQNGYSVDPYYVESIQSVEGDLTSGNPDPKNPKYKGGLPAIFHDIQNDGQGWQSTSTTSQLNLEMRMTEIQQEWTVVSTSLQTLFQSYKVFASGIGGR